MKLVAPGCSDVGEGAVSARAHSHTGATAYRKHWAQHQPAADRGMSRRLLKFSGGSVTQFLTSARFQRRVSETATA